MMRAFSLLIGVWLLVGQAAGIAVPRPTQVCPLISFEQAPLIDGGLDDEVSKSEP